MDVNASVLWWRKTSKEDETFSDYLDFSQIGIITLVVQLAASLLQALVGLYPDQRPIYLALPSGMASSIAGLILLSVAPGYGAILLSVG